MRKSRELGVGVCKRDEGEGQCGQADEQEAARGAEARRSPGTMTEGRVHEAREWCEWGAEERRKKRVKR